jgi:hypothetical protein
MGLIGGMARTAVVAGTATAVSNRVSRRQARRWSAQEPPPDQYEQEQYEQPPQQYAPPPPQPAPPVDMSAKFEQLKQLGELKEQGLLTAAEFEQQKARLLA